MEGEDRGRREAGQHRNRFTSTDCKAQWLAGLEGDAVHQYPRRPESRKNTIGKIAYALRGASRKHDHVAGSQRVTHRRFKFRLIVGKDAVMHGLTTGFLNRSAHNRAVG